VAGGIALGIIVLLALYGAGELLLKLLPAQPVSGVPSRDGPRGAPVPVNRGQPLWHAHPTNRGARELGTFDLVLRPMAEPEVQRLRDGAAL